MGHPHLRYALHKVVALHAPGNLEVETLLVKSGGLVDKLRVHCNAVGERAVQALERVDVPLEDGEEIAHFLVAAGPGLAEVPDGCASHA